MKRFKDCSISCVPGQSLNDLAYHIKEKSIEKSYQLLEDQNAIQSNDTFSILFDKDEYPICRLILWISSEANSVKIINVVPDRKSNIFTLSIDQYNQVLDFFKDDVFLPIKEKFGNEITETSASYSIEDIIPESSKYLKRWLDAYPLSGHTYDQERWFDFLISLIENDESLSLDDFAKFIKEYKKWCEDDIEKFELKLEEEFALLRYYNNGKH